jgi:hypothetical protein
MGRKMNWDRVRKENLVFKHGSASVDAGKVTDPPSRRKFRSLPGCTCGKEIGFVGAHKKRCALGGDRPPTTKPVPNDSRIGPSIPLSTALSPSKDVTLLDLASSLGKAGVSGLWREFVHLQRRMIDSDLRLNLATRKEATRVIDNFLQML